MTEGVPPEILYCSPAPHTFEAIQQVLSGMVVSFAQLDQIEKRLLKERFLVLVVDMTSLETPPAELLHRLRQAPLNRDTPILILCPAQQSLNGATQGVNVDYLATPYAPPELRHRVNLLQQLAHAQQTNRQQNVMLRTEQAQRARLEAQVSRYRNYFEMEVQKRTTQLEQKIQELLALQKALRKAEARYRAIFENAVEGIFQSTPEGHYLRVNPALARIYGFESPQALMAALNDIEHQLYVMPERRLEFIRLMEQQDTVINFEAQVYRQDGSIIWIRENARAVRDEQRNLLYYEGTVVDITERKQARDLLLEINQASDRFVPYRLLQLLGKQSITELSLNDCVQRNMSILFMDIRSFTTISETMTPLENFQFLNRFLSHMGPIIRKHQGFIDKYLGDGIMALFETPTNAVHAGIAMLQGLAVYNEARHKNHDESFPWKGALEIGIGINTGEVSLGTVGDDNRLEGTVIGDTVNLAARIEQLTKHYQVPMLIGQACYQQLDKEMQAFSRSIDQVAVKGKTKLVIIHEVFAADPSRQRAKKAATKHSFEQAWRLYQRKNYKEALQLLDYCLAKNQVDAVAQTYHEQCKAHLIRQTLIEQNNGER